MPRGSGRLRLTAKHAGRHCQTFPDVPTDDARLRRYRRLFTNGGVNGLVQKRTREMGDTDSPRTVAQLSDPAGFRCAQPRPLRGRPAAGRAAAAARTRSRARQLLDVAGSLDAASLLAR